jgi:hypothetical protein
MDLAEADRAPDLLLNEIVWRSVRGPNSKMPPPVRAAWLKRGVGDDDDDERDADDDDDEKREETAGKTVKPVIRPPARPKV